MPKNREKIVFPMQTAKNLFHTLVLHLKNIIYKNTLSWMYFYYTFTDNFYARNLNRKYSGEKRHLISKF